jgi:NADPH:quinone reductase-like Zn-dependent oxidoreductase
MRAVVYDPDAPRGFRFAEVAEPRAAGNQVLIEVAAASLNFGEISPLTRAHQPGKVPGWDAAGVIVRAAQDGSGPPQGSRVVSFASAGGAWAQRRVADIAELTVLPDEVEFGAASALPAAGVTALRALRRLGSVLGRRVLVTGASGGVGRYAVQLAALSGAWVIASVSSRARGEGLRELGAAEVVVGLEQVSAPVFGVLDNVGGSQLARAFELLGADGSIQQIGIAANQPTTFTQDALELGHYHGSKRIESFGVGGGFGPDLEILVRLLAGKQLNPATGWRGPWGDLDQAIDSVLGRRVLGKAVLDIASA